MIRRGYFLSTFSMIKTVSLYLLFLFFALSYALLTPPGEAPGSEDEKPKKDSDRTI